MYARLRRELHRDGETLGTLPMTLRSRRRRQRAGLTRLQVRCNMIQVAARRTTRRTHSTSVVSDQSPLPAPFGVAAKGAAVLALAVKAHAVTPAASVAASALAFVARKLGALPVRLAGGYARSNRSIRCGGRGRGPRRPLVCRVAGCDLGTLALCSLADAAPADEDADSSASVLATCAAAVGTPAFWHAAARRSLRSNLRPNKANCFTWSKSCLAAYQVTYPTPLVALAAVSSSWRRWWRRQRCSSPCT